MSKTDIISDIENQSAFSRACHSIRTRYALLTAVFLLVALAAFYVGGRIVLVHFVRETEQQVKWLGYDVRKSVEKGAEKPSDGAQKLRDWNVFDVAFDFYTGGFWNAADSSEVIELPVRVENGRVLETAQVPVRQLFSEVSQSAIWRLVFAIAVAGLLFVLPLFWFQSRVLLNPLTRMTKEIAQLGRHSTEVDCPRLTWKGKDEFALLAASVNQMLEIISQRTISIAQTEARHQALIDGLPDALAIFDPLGRLVAISKEAENSDPMPGLEPGSAPSAEIFGQLTVERFLKEVGDVFRDGRVGRVRMLAPESARVFELRLTRMDEYFALAIVRDISDIDREHRLRLAAEARVKEGEKRESLTLLAAGIAHDMNNVLSVVLGAAEAHDSDPSSDYDKTMSTIREAVRRGTSMMHELMTFAGESKIALKRLNPQIVIDDVKLLANRAVGENIIIDYRCAADAPDVDADPNQFWKVIFNIVKNAGEAIKDRPGRIVVSAERCKLTRDLADDFHSAKPLAECVGTLFMIADDGPGIAPELLPRIFDPFVSSKAVGRGLGLATVCSIVEAHGGGIAVKSIRERGTTFLIFLPESRLPRAVVKAVVDDPEKALTGEVLVVDDDDMILKTSSILLRSMKLVPFTAKDNQEALAVVRRRTDTLGAIILDANLGGVDTVRLLSAFRTTAPEVPVIVASGSAEESIRSLFASAPFDAFLAKPYTMTELKELLVSHLRRKDMV